MDGATIARFIEIALAVSGLAILFFASRAFLSSHAWGEGAEYEMLDLPVPEGPEGPSGEPVPEGRGMPGDGSGAFPWDGGDVERTPRNGDEGVRPADSKVNVGIEDRITRLGFSVALTYLAITWFGWGSVAMWLLGGPVLYFIVTSCLGVDPVYRWLGVTTRMD